MIKMKVFVVAIFILFNFELFAQNFTWTEQTSVGSRNWYGVSCSSDGSKIVAGVGNGYIYTSTNSGISWTEQTSAGSRLWVSITSSSDGTKLAAGAYSVGYIYTSTNSGILWTEQTSAGNNWRCITSSSDGSKIVAGQGSGYIYTSTNSGISWTRQNSAGSRQWYGIASSSDGTKLAACSYAGYIYTSTNSGATWTEQTSAGSRLWNSISSSSDGIKLAASSNGYIYTSTNSGATWTEQTSAGSRYFEGITSSSDGTKLATCVYGGGYIYTSTNSGVTWTEQTLAGNRNWWCISYSSDGSKIVATTYGGYIYTGVLSASNSINISSLSPINYCPGGSVSVPYSITGIFNSGNVFTAQLSNSSGSFLNPTSIGTLTSTSAGTISATIPSGITAGSGYRIRVVSSNPTVTGSENGSDITVYDLPSQFSVTGGGSYCSGSGGIAVGLSSSQSNTSYQLKRNNLNIGSPVIGSGNPISFGDQAIDGTYTVIGLNTTNGCTQPMLGNAILTSIPAPGQFAVTGGGSFCEGDIGVKVGLASSNFSVISYQLKLNGSNVGQPKSGTGSALDFGYQTSSGNYTIEATNQTTNCTALMTGTAVVVKNPIPTKPTISKSGNDLISSASTGNQWYFNNNLITGAMSMVYTATNSGKYTVKVTQNGCTSQMSDVLDVVIDADKLVAGFNANPTTGDAPLNVTFTDASTGKAPTSWAWDFGDAGTSTQQHPTHNYTKSGSYTVKLTVSNGISNDTKSKVAFIVVSDAPNVKADFKAVPTTGETPLNVQFTDMSTGSPTDWFWDFGDGFTNTTQNPNHSYSIPGNYTVRLIISKGSRKDTVTKTNYITVNSIAPLKADLVADVTIGETPLTVQFTDKSTGKPTTWSWDFGDAGTSKEQNPSHTYSKAGVYTVGLTVSDGKTIESTSKSAYITVKDVLPLKAEFSGTPLTGEIPLIVQFTDQSTGKPTIYSWEFGDGGKSSEKNPSYTYTKSGKYTVKLTVSDGKTIETNTKPDYIIPTDPLPLASEFKADVTNGTAPLTVKFTDLSTGHPKIWSWEFGDGQTDNTQNPSHVYSTNGTYSVKLSVSDGSAIKTQTKNAYITVGGSSGNGEGTISIKDATSNTGEIVTIPIYLTDIKNITDETTGFTATLYCNATVLHPEGSTPLGIVNDSLVRIIDLSMPAKPDANGIIYNLKFLVMLGNDIGTYILIDNITPVGKNILVNSATYSKFLIGNIKTEGGVRLVVNKNKMIKLTQCDPNPASDKINLTVETNISDIISLDLYNLFGDKVLNVFSGQLNEGQTEYKIVLNNITTGSYYILLKHSDGTLSRMVQVIK